MCFTSTFGIQASSALQLLRPWLANFAKSVSLIIIKFCRATNQPTNTNQVAANSWLI